MKFSMAVIALVLTTSNLAMADSYKLTRVDQGQYLQIVQTIRQFISNGVYKGTDASGVCGLEVGADILADKDAIAIQAGADPVVVRSLLPEEYVPLDLLASIVLDTSATVVNSRLRIITNYGNEAGFETDALDLQMVNGSPVSFRVGANYGRIQNVNLVVTDSDFIWSDSCLNLVKTN